MSASEIIAEIRKLPSAEQDQVLDFLQNERRQRKTNEPEVHYASDADFEKSADKVLREHEDLLRRLAQ